jgi:hypothetical protein
VVWGTDKDKTLAKIRETLAKCHCDLRMKVIASISSLNLSREFCVLTENPNVQFGACDYAES